MEIVLIVISFSYLVTTVNIVFNFCISGIYLTLVNGNCFMVVFGSLVGATASGLINTLVLLFSDKLVISLDLRN